MIRYVQDVPEKLERGQIWKVDGFAQTARIGNETLKSYAGLFDEDSAHEALECWQRLGFKGYPASPISFYRAMYEKLKRENKVNARMNGTWNALFRRGFYGGWIEMIQPGFNQGPLYHYDVNKAYYWAGLEGLPTRVVPYHAGAKNFLVLAEIKGHERDLPVMIENRKRVILTNQDIELYKIKPKIIDGISWEDDCPVFYPRQVFEELNGRVPGWILKRAMSQYWGIHAQTGAVVREIWKGGELSKKIPMNNRNQNIIWAQMTIARVTRKVYQTAADHARQVYVDSILTDTQIETSARIGDWKLVDEFPKGVVIKAPGVWTPYPVGRKVEINSWHKHAGYSDV